MKILNKFNTGICLLAITCLIGWSSCKTEKIRPVTEPVKDITGTWKIIKATRVGEDITNAYGADFSQFSITFTGNTYTVKNQLPFIVNTDGTYSLDDPQYPFQISFKPTSGTAQSSTFNYPIVVGVRNLSLTFNPNSTCKLSKNIYVYKLVKVN